MAFCVDNNRGTRMSKVVRIVAVASAVALAVSSGMALAEAKKASGPNIDNKAEAKSDPTANAVSMTVIADQLARYGDEKKDPLALIVAARLKKEAGGTEEARKKETKGGKDEQAKSGADMSADALLGRAKKLAGERKDIVALADETAGTRGVVGGPRTTATVVRSGGVDIFHVPYRGGEVAAVGLGTDGNSNLGLYVYDQNGNPICRATAYGDVKLCKWVPAWSGAFRVEVVNPGYATAYRLLTN